MLHLEISSLTYFPQLSRAVCQRLCPLPEKMWPITGWLEGLEGLAPWPKLGQLWRAILAPELTEGSAEPSLTTTVQLLPLPSLPSTLPCRCISWDYSTVILLHRTLCPKSASREHSLMSSLVWKVLKQGNMNQICLSFLSWHSNRWIKSGTALELGQPFWKAQHA